MGKLKELALKGARVAYRNLPDISLAGGIIFSVAATGLAIYETAKLVRDLNEQKNTIVPANEEEEHEIKRKNHLMIAKRMTPVVCAEAAAVTFTVIGRNTYHTRLTAVSDALTTFIAAFATYRGRVATKYGDEEERKLYYGIEEKEVEEKDENGKKVKKKITTLSDGPVGDPYTYIWDNSSSMFNTQPGEAGNIDNALCLQAAESYFNSLLKSRIAVNHPGYVYLNEVLNYLDIETTKAGQCVGWIWDPDGNDVGDNEIKIRSTVVKTPNAYDPEKTVDGFILEFNCDGNILERAWEKD